MSTGPPLQNIHVLELAGLAPGPFCGQLLSSYGATVLRIDRPGPPTADVLTSHKSSIVLELKRPESIRVLHDLLRHADVLIDPFRPGVLEKLGLDPSGLARLNPRLITVRLTGFRRDGKYAQMAGHDINYLAASGVLSMLGARNTPPLHPGNILADFAGGGLVAFAGVLLALMARAVSGRGQVVNANMVDGVGYLGTFPRLLRKVDMWAGERGTNVLDGGAPYYGCYECRDGDQYVSVGALEPQFFARLLEGLDLKIEQIVPQKGMKRDDKRAWPYMRDVFTRKFKEKTRREWEAVFDGTDACVVPVLKMDELEAHDYDLRPLVELDQSPARPVDAKWMPKMMKPGQGGEETLKQWMGWKRGKDFEVAESGALVIKEKSKL